MELATVRHVVGRRVGKIISSLVVKSTHFLGLSIRLWVNRFERVFPPTTHDMGWDETG